MSSNDANAESFQVAWWSSHESQQNYGYDPQTIQRYWQ